MTFRMLGGIQPREDFPALPIFQELLREKHLIIADHTRRHLRDEIQFPGPVIDRANSSRWRDEGSLTLGERASNEVESLIGEWEPTPLGEEIRDQLIQRMEDSARLSGMDTLPSRGE